MATIDRSRTTAPRTIVIAGAGIGGLTAALALAEIGFNVVVAERSDHLAVVGAGIQIGPNAGRILARLGLEDAMAAAAIEPATLEIRSGSSGRVLTEIPGTAFQERYGAPYRVLHRADLQSLLADAVAAHPAIRLELDATVPEFLVQDGGLLVRVQGGAGGDVVPAEAIIGADGVWSALREKIAGTARPKPTGHTAWRALIAADDCRGLVAMDRVGLWLGRNAHLVHYPVTRGAAVNIVAIVTEKFERRGWSAAGERGDLARHFAGWPAEARRLLAVPLNWQKFAMHTVDADATWTDGRLALLGDAAHAMRPFLAQGGAMAIEDAAVLADVLRDATDIPAALRRYEAERKPRVMRMAAESAQTGDIYHLGGIKGAARNLALRVSGEKMFFERSDWIYRWAPEPPAGPTPTA